MSRDWCFILADLPNIRKPITCIDVGSFPKVFHSGEKIWRQGKKGTIHQWSASYENDFLVYSSFPKSCTKNIFILYSMRQWKKLYLKLSHEFRFFFVFVLIHLWCKYSIPFNCILRPTVSLKLSMNPHQCSQNQENFLGQSWF